MICLKKSFTLYIVLLAVYSSVALANNDDLDTCTAADENLCKSTNFSFNELSEERHLKNFTFDIGNGEEQVLAYVPPDISTYYQLPDKTKVRRKTSYKGMAGKFFNLSPEPQKLMWDPGNGRESAMIGIAEPFQAIGTATFPGHLFYFTPKKSRTENVRYRFQVKSQTSLYVYDPYLESPDDTINLSSSQLEMYKKQRDTIAFSNQYKEYTGREWLSNFKRPRPLHFMWPANYFGEEYNISTTETYVVSQPPAKELKKLPKTGPSESQRELFRKYQSPETTLNLTMKVLSCEPRVFEIKNFLSDVEIEHIYELATGLKLGASTTSGDNTDNKYSGKTETRTSTNTWVYRHSSPIVDVIYRRAAELMHIDEALFRQRNSDEFPDYPSKLHQDSRTITEALQLVHYDPGQQYTPHHDFGYPKIHSPTQPTRFATLLL